ncbi:MAG: ABC transporter ATP-binding protein [Candidatus Bathyarchaeota archaeon]
MNLESAVEVQNVIKDFGEIRALENLNFNVDQGEIYGLIGPNGAGKTTTLRIVATLLAPTSGLVRVFGLNVVGDNSKVRKLISYLPEEAGAYKNLSGNEYLEFMASFYTEKRADTREMVEAAIEISGLEERLRDKVKTYSKGMKRRLLVARALMIKPKLAILDEPTSGLDVVHAYHVRKIIRDYVGEQGVTALVSSHNMLEVDFLCDRVALINRGRIIGEGTPSELKSRYEASNLEEVFVEATGLAK